MAKSKITKKLGDATSKGAMAGVLNELFQDMYEHRWEIYKMNFIRGLVFGFGGVVGGTIVVILLAWLLSFFDQLPIIGHFVETIRRSLETTSQ